MGDEDGNIPFDTSSDYKGGQWIGGEFFYETERKRKKQTKEQQIYGIWADDDDDEVENKTSSFGEYSNTMNVSATSFFVKAGTLEDAQKAPSYSGVKPRKAKAPPKIETARYSSAALKMMKMMGYKQGAGLGKNEQGMAVPIDVQARPVGMGLEFNEYQERTEQSLRDFEGKSAADQDDDEDDDGLTLSTYYPKKKKKRFRHEVSGSNLEKFVDMTSTKPTEEEPKYLFPQLRHNVQLIFDKKEAALNINRQQINEDQNFLIQLDKEKELTNTGLISSQQFQIDRLDEILSQITSCSPQKSSNKWEEFGDEKPRISRGTRPVTLETLEKVFADFVTDYFKEWVKFHLDALSFHLVFPLISKELDAWNPLTESPEKIIAIIITWKPLLDIPTIIASKAQILQQHQDKVGHDGISPLHVLKQRNIFSENNFYDDEDPDHPSVFDFGSYKGSNFLASSLAALAKEKGRANYYHLIFYRLVFPRLRSCYINQWSARDHKQTRLLESWVDVFPPNSGIQEELIDHAIMPKLMSEVKRWDPLTDRELITTWLHPWLALIGNSKMEVLWDTIKSKLSQLLTARWKVSDGSALVMVSPWRGNISDELFDAFLKRNIFPKILEAFEKACTRWLQGPPPTNKELTTLWPHVFNWVETFPDLSVFVNMLCRNFFPPWFQILHSWLVSEPNFDEVTGWYLHWKKQIPGKLVNNPQIVTQFNSALDMMQSVLNPTGKILPPPPIHSISDDVSSRSTKSTIPTAPGTSSAYSSSSINLKDLLSNLAEEHGISFIPSGRTHAQTNRPIYKFGNIFIYFHKEVIFAQVQQKWAPVSMETLLSQKT